MRISRLKKFLEIHLRQNCATLDQNDVGLERQIRDLCNVRVGKD